MTLMKNTVSIPFGFILITILAVLTLGACSKSEDPNAEKSAEFNLPNSTIRVIITTKRRAVDSAEFERYLYVTEANQNLFWTKLSTDTGGKGRAQIYKNDAGYVLIDYNHDRFLVKPTEKRVMKRPADASDAVTGEYLGAFDYDKKATWRFIPKSEQAEVALPG